MICEWHPLSTSDSLWRLPNIDPPKSCASLVVMCCSIKNGFWFRPDGELNQLERRVVGQAAIVRPRLHLLSAFLKCNLGIPNVGLDCRKTCELFFNNKGQSDTRHTRQSTLGLSLQFSTISIQVFVINEYRYSYPNELRKIEWSRRRRLKAKCTSQRILWKKLRTIPAIIYRYGKRDGLPW